jgi:hypothetical protein
MSTYLVKGTPLGDTGVRAVGNEDVRYLIWNAPVGGQITVTLSATVERDLIARGSLIKLS